MFDILYKRVLYELHEWELIVNPRKLFERNVRYSAIEKKPKQYQWTNTYISLQIVKAYWEKWQKKIYNQYVMSSDGHCYRTNIIHVITSVS
jgi:hypothetical protein